LCDTSRHLFNNTANVSAQTVRTKVVFFNKISKRNLLYFSFPFVSEDIPELNNISTVMTARVISCQYALRGLFVFISNRRTAQISVFHLAGVWSLWWIYKRCLEPQGFWPTYSSIDIHLAASRCTGIEREALCHGELENGSHLSPHFIIQQGTS